jgi:hypothetical protein
MNDVSPPNRARFRQLPAASLRVVRGVLGRVVQPLFQDQLRAVRRQTENLGTSSVESATYLGVELQALDRRLSKIEADVARLRELVEAERPRA